MAKVVTKYTTKDGLRVYDLDLQASELFAVAGPDGVDPATIDPWGLPEGFRWVTGEEWGEMSIREKMRRSATRKKIAAAVDAAGLCCPADVVGAWLRVAESGGDWREEFKRAIINDAKEAAKLCL